MIRTVRMIPLLLLIALLIVGCGSEDLGSKPPSKATENAAIPPKPVTRTVSHDAGAFTINIPEGWLIETGGQCATLAFTARDPSEPLNQIFFFSNVGPVYLSEQKKRFDFQYVQSGGYDIAWLDMPVVAPLNPENFLQNWSYIVRSRIARNFMRQLPQLDGFRLISEETASSSLTAPGSTGKLLRGLFVHNGRPGQGLFSLATVPQPYAGIGFGLFLAGITAEKRSFAGLLPVLARCLDSFYLKDAYAQDCRRMQAQQFEAMLQVGRTLSETSDLITRGWQNRSRSADILSEKWSDTILGKERLYDPDSGEVYEFNQGFYDRYRLENGSFNRTALVPIPADNHDLWSRAPLNGGAHIRKER